jgi:tetratricopeptide (TPR) repeat protein
MLWRANEWERRGVGLNDIVRRRELVKLLDIPPILFGLATAPERQHTETLDAPWWVQLGFPAFDAGSDNFPHPGQVLRHFRPMKLKEDGKPWTQRDLALALGKQELAVREMELRGTGLNDISRRRFLADLFSIPLILLGLAAHPQQQHMSQKAFPRRTIQPQEKLFAYQGLLSSHWDAYFTMNPPDALQKMCRVVSDLQGITPYVTSNQQPLARELLCHYHQLTLDMSRDRGNHELALSQASLAITLAETFEEPELLVSALYRRGLTHFDTDNLRAAYEDLNHATSFTRNRDSQLKGMVFLEAGRFLAHLAHDRVEKLQVYHWLEQTEIIVQRGDLEEDSCHVHLDRGRFHIGKAATFLSLRRFAGALDELDLADRLTKKEQIRRHAYIDILRAKVYFAQGEPDYATELALSTLIVCLAIQSHSNIADIARLYHSLRQSSFGASPLVTRLGVLLRVQK